MSDDWKARFRELYHSAQERYRAGRNTTLSLFEPDEVYFLATIGCSSRELFDFIEDSIKWNDVEYDQVEGVTELRRDHFVNALRSEDATTQLDSDKIPAKADEVDGIAWLPRLIVKARAKLAGKLPPELMYGCGGDRPFLREHKSNLVDFLRVTLEAGDDDRAIIDYIKDCSAKG
ncbi:MAG TPA: DUF5069 domain-containing protein [Verrucomicrobiota bacterium]|nr:DUF5069 domain-containing protein [Verrucomicrobiota bacterium]|tara:strand:- start:47 stop:571 length:525 start_codon:yes stop_codon:yes gene_type:complete